jgi:hypothetical protein
MGEVNLREAGFAMAPFARSSADVAESGRKDGLAMGDRKQPRTRSSPPSTSGCGIPPASRRIGASTVEPRTNPFAVIAPPQAGADGSVGPNHHLPWPRTSSEIPQ